LKPDPFRRFSVSQKEWSIPISFFSVENGRVKILALTIRLLAAAPLLLLAALLPGPSLAQTLEGSLTDRESGLPVDGALVLLMDGEGQELLGRISDEEGLFRLVAPGPGSYRLRVVRIGYASFFSDPIPLLEGDTEVVHLEARDRQFKGPMDPSGYWRPLMRCARGWWSGARKGGGVGIVELRKSTLS